MGPASPPKEPSEGKEIHSTTLVEASQASPQPQDRAARFAALKARATQSTRQNLTEAKAEAARASVNPQTLSSLSRKSALAQHNLLKADTEEEEGKGAFERKRAWDYTIEESEKWDDRVARKRKVREDNVFNDHSAEAEKVYERQMKELEKSRGQKSREDYEAEKAELVESAATGGGLEIVELQDGSLVAVDNAGTFYANSESTNFVESKPKRENVDRLVEDLRKAEEVRLRKRRERMVRNGQDEGDVTFINDKNKQFNQKLARFYDKYTTDIREAFERGTAI